MDHELHWVTRKSIGVGRVEPSSPGPSALSTSDPFAGYTNDGNQSHTVKNPLREGRSLYNPIYTKYDALTSRSSKSATKDGLGRRVETASTKAVLATSIEDFTMKL
jgi:hypothetical protein